MAKNEASIAALLSVKPNYADALLTGSKLVEFRRSSISPEIEYFVVYATSPIRRVIGICCVSSVIKDTPRNLWSRYKEIGGVTKQEFDDYFFGVDQGFAIQVSSAIYLEAPLSLYKISPKLRAPQSFQYLTDVQFQRVQQRISPAA